MPSVKTSSSSNGIPTAVGECGDSGSCHICLGRILAEGVAGYFTEVPTFAIEIDRRIDFMQDRINRSASQGWISGREINGANRELNFIRSEDQRLRYQDGGHLRPEDRDYLQGRLDALSQRLHWAAHNG